MQINWKNIDENITRLVENWLSNSDRQNLCLTTKTWQQTATDIYENIRLMDYYQFKNVIGFINDTPAIAIMFGVENFGEVLTIYNIVVCPNFRRKGIAKNAIRQIIEDNCLHLNKTFKKIRICTVVGNLEAENFFKSLGFSFKGFDGDYNEFVLPISNSNEIYL